MCTIRYTTVIDVYLGFSVNKIITYTSGWYVLGDNVKVTGEDVTDIIK
jgi:hypothetical protein